MAMGRSLWCVALLAGATVGVQAQGNAALTAIRRAEAGVKPENIRAQVKFISDDLFEGRYPGLRGGELAAKYIASQFALYGLKPAGDDGTYLQQINFVGMKAKPERTSFSIAGVKTATKLTFGEDYTVSNQTLTADTDIDAPIVFVGYGVTAPEFRWDDYA